MGELPRRLVHAGGAAVPALYLVGLVTWDRLRLLYVVGVGVVGVLEVLRLRAGLDWWIYRELIREYERDNPAGYALYVVGSAAVVLAFEPRIAVPAVLALALVDPVSGLLHDGRRDVKRPFVMAVTFLLSGVIAAWFVPPGAAVLGALAVTLADGATPVIAGYVIDDNVTIPVGAAAAMWLGVRYLPGAGL